MALGPGTRIGPYEILAALGAGGMGEVYRASDASLGRDVAIKVLPARFTQDPDRLMRFEREARLLASISHPSIAHVYGLVPWEGAHALVMELVPGDTLADRIRRSALPIVEALPIARQIADALAAAHDHGIVHRDLKPANIKVTESGAVKVLDFGLAKALSDDPFAVADDATVTSPAMTADGVILGTGAYMSPEQARGKPVDKRADVWAFGCVLYEMLAGVRAFRGETVTDTLAAVLERQPDWGALPATTPEAIRRLVRRCLEKDPARRLRDIGDVRLEIEEALTAGSAATVPSAKPTRRRWQARHVILAGVGLVALAILAGIAFYPRDPVRVVDGAPPVAASTIQLTRLTFDPGLQTDPALSPDGRFVAYSSNKAGNFDIYTQPVSGGNPVRVTTDPAHDWQLDWSVKDQIVFRSERDGGGLYVVAQTGGHETRVSTFGNRPQWSPDGTMILFSRAPTTIRYLVGLDGAPPRECKECGVGPYGWFGDARHVARLQTGAAPGYLPRLETVDLERGTVDEWTASPSVLTGFRDLGISAQGYAPLVWSADGRAVYFAGLSRRVSIIWKLDVDPAARTIAGGPHRTAAMAGASTGVTAARSGGAVAFAAADRTARIWWYSLDPSGRRIIGQPQALTPAETESQDPSVTPDGRLLVFSVQRPGGQSGADLRVRTLSDGVERILRVSDTARGEGRHLPLLSPDGKRVVFRYIPPESQGPGRGGGVAGPQQLRVIDLETLEESSVTKLAPGLVMPHGWSADGRFVVTTLGPRRIEPGPRTSTIGLLPLAGAPDAETQLKVITTSSSSSLFQPSVSPNGRWVAFVVGITFRIAVVGSKDGQWNEPQDRAHWRYLDEDLAPKDKPRWSPDGRLLYFTSARGGLLNVWAVDFDPTSGATGKPFQVTGFDGPDAQMPGDVAWFEIAVARGGLAVPTVHPTGGIWLLHPPR